MERGTPASFVGATLEGLAEASQLAIWQKRESGPLSANVWASEIRWTILIGILLRARLSLRKEPTSRSH